LWPPSKVRSAIVSMRLMLDMVSVALDQLGDAVGWLAQEGRVIADALDELLTRSWG
jgi:toxin CcdB